MSEIPPIYQTLSEDPAEPLEVFSADELCDLRFKRVSWLVDGFLRPGLTVLAGSPKVGKSWLVLQLCVRIAQGRSFWGLDTHQGSVLYFALEDSKQRLQNRLLTLTEAPPEGLYLSMNCSGIGEELEREIGSFYIEHPDLRLIVIDTFQMIRDRSQQMSYANDYAEVARLKYLADTMNICILLVHHTRKMSDSDRFNEISGTNGIAGSADTLLVLTKEKRSDSKAMLSCTGRDIEDRELSLTMDRRTCMWKCTTPLSVSAHNRQLPEELNDLIAYMKKVTKFEGANALFTERLSEYCGKSISAIGLKRNMNRFRFELEDRGISFLSTRTENQRSILIVYRASRDLSIPVMTDHDGSQAQ